MPWILVQLPGRSHLDDLAGVPGPEVLGELASELGDSYGERSGGHLHHLGLNNYHSMTPSQNSPQTMGKLT